MAPAARTTEWPGHCPRQGRIYECNRADDRIEKSFPHCLWGESIYAFVTWVNNPLVQSAVISPLVGAILGLLFGGFNNTPSPAAPVTVQPKGNAAECSEYCVGSAAAPVPAGNQMIVPVLNTVRVQEQAQSPVQRNVPAGNAQVPAPAG